MVATGKTVGLAEWIIDDTCLVVLFIDPRGRLIVTAGSDHYLNNFPK